MSAPFSPIITMAALVLPETTVGMIEPSTTRRRSIPRRATLARLRQANVRPTDALV
jgi:hypothetical protein